MPIQEIIPLLFLGDSESAKIFFNKFNKKITHIDCNKDLHFLGSYKQIKNIFIKNNVEKHELYKLYTYFSECSDFIYQNIKNNIIVVVHCMDCHTISPYILVAYLIKYGKLNIENAVNIIKSKINIQSLNEEILILLLQKLLIKTTNENKIYSI